MSEKVDEYREQQEQFNSDGGSKVYPKYLDVKPGMEAVLRFIDKDPIKFYQHRVFDPQSKKGKGGYRVFSCTRDSDCPLCTAGDQPTFKVAWQVVHTDNLDEKGKVTPRVKMLVKGIKFAEYFESKQAKCDFEKQNVTLERIGKGQNTQYVFSEFHPKSAQKYNESEVIELEEYFGVDDEKFRDMERIAAYMIKHGGDSSAQGSRSPLEDDEDDVPR